MQPKSSMSGTKTRREPTFDEWSIEPRLAATPPRLNIVIMVIGSRGDIQPFLAVARELIGGWGHRVRVATHPEFEEMVNEELQGLGKDNGGEGEFFSVGGDPQELMAFMVKNPGLFPSLETIKKGEINRRREQMAEMFEGFWRACVTPFGGDGSAKKEVQLKAEEKRAKKGKNKKGIIMRYPGTKSFIADAIIANPPSFAHIHCAERLGIPLHMMFTFPYTPTTTIPHPLANISQSNIEAAYTNLISYSMVEVMTWQGLGDLVNNFRKKTLGLEPLIPTTYMWSPSLIPKPADWGPHIDISGFVFLNKASSFTPPPELQAFLDEEPDNKPVYIGFGSIVVDDPDALTKLIFEAVEKTGIRALVSKGWGGLGADEVGHLPKGIYMLENTPHDWLFPQCRAVIHHGGAGTTAIGLKCGKPTYVVSFFGDQPFWGTMIKNAGAGSWSPFKDLTLDKLVEGIEIITRGETAEKAHGMAEKIALEGDGAKNAVMSFYRALERVGVSRMVELLHTPGIRCSLLPTHVAVWRIKHTEIRLSALAAHVLCTHDKLTYKDLRLIRHTEWNGFGGPGEPLSGGFSALLRTVGSIGKGLICVPYSLFKSASSHPDSPIQDVKPKSRSSDKNDKKQKANEKATVTSTTTHGGGGGYQDAELTNISFSHQLAHATGSNLQQVVHTVFRAPIDFTVSIALGFHNAPLLYGDQVRRPQRITGIHSGLKAAAKEVVFGISDTATGLVLKPYHGAQQDGVLGFLSGVGMGLGGIVFATGAATFGIPGYTLKGVHKELRKGTERKLEDRVRSMRVWQGEEEVKDMTARLEMEEEEERKQQPEQEQQKRGQQKQQKLHEEGDAEAYGEGETNEEREEREERNINEVNVNPTEILREWEEELVREMVRRDEAESQLKKDIKSFRRASSSAAKLERLKKRNLKKERKRRMKDDLKKQEAVQA
ncbi:hypothetical protein DFH27DRAFT_593343 [Peziza echinospora]|nr:hypothetical protein DFH27DRAFT_593343 [Peziza echinospora]